MLNAAKVLRMSGLNFINPSLLDQAIEFLEERGWPMLPSAGASKKPCVRWRRFQSELPTAEQLRSWDAQFSPQRWSVVTGSLSGIVVVDFDRGQGVAQMHRWGIAAHVQTGSGGFHLYLQHPGWKVPTLNAKTGSRFWPWPGVDVRGDGGFAVLLGRNQNGPYTLLRDLVPEPFEALPEELRDFVRTRGGSQNTEPSHPAAPRIESGDRVDPERLIQQALTTAVQSGRNNAGFALACQLRDNGFSQPEAEAVLQLYRSRVGATDTKGQRAPYLPSEMMASLRQAYSRPAREPWARRPHAAGAGTETTPPRIRGGEVDDQPVAVDPPSFNLYVDPPGDPQVGPSGGPLPRFRYARVPREVLADRRLSPRDVRVYAVLAGHCWQGNVATLGKRRISLLAGCAQRKVLASLKALESTGHIQKYPERRRGQRGIYLLTSKEFAQKQRAGIEDLITLPNGRRRLVSVRREQRGDWRRL